jgi:hypothetical protein
MYIRNKNGTLVPVQTLKGNDGKSAYSYALDGGYTGTEEEFIENLGREVPTVDTINALIDAKIATIPNAEEASF